MPPQDRKATFMNPEFMKVAFLNLGVAVHRDRIAGAAHLVRYGTDDRVSPGMRDWHLP